MTTNSNNWNNNINNNNKTLTRRLAIIIFTHLHTQTHTHTCHVVDINIIASLFLPPLPLPLSVSLSLPLSVYLITYHRAKQNQCEMNKRITSLAPSSGRSCAWSCWFFVKHAPRGNHQSVSCVTSLQICVAVFVRSYSFVSYVSVFCLFSPQTLVLSSPVCRRDLRRVWPAHTC